MKKSSVFIAVIVTAIVCFYIGFSWDKWLIKPSAPNHQAIAIPGLPQGYLTDIPGLNVNNLRDAQKKILLKVLNETKCSCAKKYDSVAKCRKFNASCKDNQKIINRVKSLVQQNFSESKVKREINTFIASLSKIEKKDIFKVPVGRSYAKGNPNAKVTIIKFSDFQCPFCSRAANTIEEVLKIYKDDVRLVFKNLPLGFHQQAAPAAKAVLAAGEQGKFWEMYKALYDGQKQLSAEFYPTKAKELGLDVEKFKIDMESAKIKGMLNEEQQLASKIGARGTPAFYVNGEKVSGAQPLHVLKEVVERKRKEAESLLSKGVSPAKLYNEIIKSGRESPPPPKPRKKAPAPPKAKARVQMVELYDSPAYGPKHAKVTIVEFSDFECPYCSRGANIMKQVIEAYQDKVKVVFKNNPLHFHPKALPAAKAVLAAQEQGKFWPFHYKLFENSKQLNQETFIRIAGEVGLNVDKFKKDLTNNDAKYQALIKRDQQQAAQIGARGTPTFFVNGMVVRGAQPFPNFKRVIDSELEKADKLLKEGVKLEDLYPEIVKRAEELSAVKIGIAHSPVLGPKDAPVTVVEFSDFQCPFCKRGHDTMDELVKKYQGKIKLVFKHQPLSFHKQAFPAAVASMAAHRQGKFWAYHDKLFENYKSLNPDLFIKIAQELKLDINKFKKDLDNEQIKGMVRADQKEASRVGADGTPTFFVNGNVIEGAVPINVFSAAVDKELKKK